MTASPSEPTLLFEPPIGRWTLIGAITGTVLVVGMFVLGVLLADMDPWVIGAAGLAAPFGGAGFGAMMGAVLGGLRAGEIEVEQRRTADERSTRAASEAEAVDPSPRVVAPFSTVR